MVRVAAGARGAEAGIAAVRRRGGRGAPGDHATAAAAIAAGAVAVAVGRRAGSVRVGPRFHVVVEAEVIAVAPSAASAAATATATAVLVVAPVIEPVLGVVFGRHDACLHFIITDSCMY